ASTYLRPSAERAARNNCRSRRIASHKNRLTSASAANGAARVRSETRSAPTSSAVAINRLPKPPVKTVDLYRVPEIVTRGRFPDGGESDSTWRIQDARHVGSDTLAPEF